MWKDPEGRPHDICPSCKRAQPLVEDIGITFNDEASAGEQVLDSQLSSFENGPEIDRPPEATHGIVNIGDEGYLD